MRRAGTDTARQSLRRQPALAGFLLGILVLTASAHEAPGVVAAASRTSARALRAAGGEPGDALRAAASRPLAIVNPR
jgi:hypothetical protein